MPRQNCDAVRAALAADQRTLSVATHLAACADCRAYSQGIAQMNGAARRLPLPVPPNLDMSRLPAIPPTALRQNQKAYRRQWLLGSAVAAALAVGIAVGPRFVASQLLVTQVRAAVAETNTWHFSGWRIVDNKRVAWEIWGRRTPFLYREQLGDNLLIANDRERLHLVPPGDHRPQGLAFVTPSSMHERLTAMDDNPEPFMEGIGGGFLRHMTQTSHSEKTITFLTDFQRIGEWGLLTIDTRKKLPVRYEYRRAMSSPQTRSDPLQSLIRLPTH